MSDIVWPMGLSGLVAAAQVVLVLGLWPDALPTPASAGERGKRRKEALAALGLFTLIEPVIRGLAMHLSFLGSKWPGRWAESRLIQAGRPLGLDAPELFALSLMTACAGAAVGGWLSAAMGRAAGAGAIVGAVLGCAFPLFRLDEVSRSRRLAISRGLPQAIDLISMAMNAGLDFPGALRQVSSQLGRKSPLGFEFEHLLCRLSLGWSRSDALGEFAARIPDQPVRQFAASVRQAEEQGTPLARVLGRQAEVMRVRRSQAAEQAAARAAVLMLVPLMLIFACVFIILLGPFVVRFLRGEMI